MTYQQRLSMMGDQQHSNYVVSAKAEAYKNQGNDEYRRKDFRKAIHFYTEGIKVNLADYNLKAQLYSNRAIAHFYLGKNFSLPNNFRP